MLLWEMERISEGQEGATDAAQLFDSTCWMKEELMEDLKHPQDNYDGPFQTFSMENTAAANVSDCVWNQIMLYVFDCTWGNGSDWRRAVRL